MAAKAIIVLADGFEEIEVVTPIDILRRAGVDVEIVGLDSTEVRGAHDIVFKADRVLTENEDADAVILPGGMPGAANLAASETLGALVKRQVEAGRVVAAICASPGVVLASLGVLEGRCAACFPGAEQHFGPDTTHVLEPVCKDGPVITSRGPGTAFAFALELVRELVDPATADQLAEAMIYG